MSGIFDQVINYAPPSLLLGTVTYKGTWSAATNTPTLSNPPSSITNGNYYVVSAAGTQFSLSFNIGDWIISNGSAWEKVDNTDAVSSVFGRTGAVVGVSTDYSSVGITATAVGASSPSTGAFTTLSATTPLAATSGGTGLSSLGTGVATFLGTPTSANLAAAVTNETGSGSLVFGTSPTITTPVIAQINDASGNETLKLASIASAVNEVTIENAATGNAVHISATGGDASVGLHLVGKGASGYVNVQDSTDATKRIMFNAAGGTTNTRTMLSSTQTVDRTLSLPDATDTLVGKATTDTLTNKTLTSPTITGGALNGTLGATTPSTIAATTVSASATSVAISATGATTSSRYFNANNTGGQLYLGVEDSVGGNVFSGSSAYSGFIGTNGNTNFHLGHNGVVKATITSTGLNSTAIGATTPSTGAFTTGTFTGVVALPSSIYSITSGGQSRVYFDATNTTLRSPAGVLFSVDATGASIAGTLSATDDATITTSSASIKGFYTNNATHGAVLGVNNAGLIRVGSTTNTNVSLVHNGNVIGLVSSTGLAVTGTLSATGAISTTATAASSISRTLSVGALIASGNLNAFGFTPNSVGLSAGYNYSGGDAETNMIFGAASSSQQMRFQGWNGTTLTTVLALVGNGNVGIGTTSPAALLHVAGVIKTSSYLLTTAVGPDAGVMFIPGSGGGTTWVIRNNAGLFELVDWTSTLTRLAVTAAGAVRFNAYGAGSLTTDGSGNITAVSDERIKSNIRPFSRGLSEIIAINPILHGYTEESGLDQSRDDYAGFSAQQVQPLIPEAIGVNADGMLSFSDRPIMAALVNAVKELSARLAALESK